MDRVEVDVRYEISDFVSAALAYRKFTGNTKTFVIISWGFIALVFVSYVMPLFLLPLICLPLGTCSPEVWWGLGRVVAIGVGGPFALLFVVQSNILYRLRMEYTHRILALRFKDDYLSTKKFILSDEGLEIHEPSYKTTIYWKSFQQVVEARESFLFLTNRKQYFIVPKRCLNNLMSVERFSELVGAYTDQPIKKI